MSTNHAILAHHFENLEQQREPETFGMWLFLATGILIEQMDAPTRVQVQGKASQHWLIAKLALFSAPEKLRCYKLKLMPERRHPHAFHRTAISRP